MILKGYWTSTSYYGYVNGKYEEFVSDTEYLEMMREESE